MFRTCCSLLLLTSLLLAGSRLALAAAVSVSPAGNGVFTINGSGMDVVAGIDLTVSYDATLLASPAVTQGSLISGALMAVNTNRPGSIKIAAVNTRPFPASGQIATISFATHTGTGRISVAASMVTLQGAAVPGGGESVAFDSPTATTTTPGFVATAGVPFSQPTATPATSGTTGPTVSITAQTSTGVPGMPGTVSMPGDVKPGSDAKPVETAAVPTPAAEPIAARPSDPPEEAAPAPKPQKTEPVKMTVIKGALDNFSTYKGEKTPAKLSALLNRQDTAAIRQEPAFALSDGTTAVKIAAELKNVGDRSPNFALHGARLVSLKRDDASFTWVIEALPQAGVMQATLTILTESEIIEYPLTVAPVVAGISPAEADFVIFLKDSGAAVPKRDLNGDGKHDYLDDFIYTVNFLSKKSSVGKAAK